MFEINNLPFLSCELLSCLSLPHLSYIIHKLLCINCSSLRTISKDSTCNNSVTYCLRFSIMDYHFEHTEYGLSCSFRPWCCSYVCIRVLQSLIYALKQCVYVRLLYDKRWLTKSSTVTLHRSSLPVRHGARWSMTNKSLYFLIYFLNSFLMRLCYYLDRNGCSE